MNILLWVLQVGLALQSLAGGQYKLFSFDQIANMPATMALPRGVWSALGVFEIVCGILVVVPAATKWMPALTPLAAAALALENLALAAFFAHYSLELAATNPMVWVLEAGLLAAFVAYGRYVLRPV